MLYHMGLPVNDLVVGGIAPAAGHLVGAPAISPSEGFAGGHAARALAVAVWVRFVDDFV